MPNATVRTNERRAWRGQSVLVTGVRGECGDALALSGFYFREARFLRTLRFTINGEPPWLCEDAEVAPDVLLFTYTHPEVIEYGGGGAGQAQDAVPMDAKGTPQRAIGVRAMHRVGVASLRVDVTLRNHSPRHSVELDLAWLVDADFADLDEVLGEHRRQCADVRALANDAMLTFEYQHPALPYRTVVTAHGAPWLAGDAGFAAHVRLEPGAELSLAIDVEPHDPAAPLTRDDTAARERSWTRWRDSLVRVRIPGNAAAERTVEANIRDIASLAMLDGRPDEWLAPAAGMPLYAALFGRDALTAGWQAAMLDGGEMARSALTRLGRMQGKTVSDANEEEPGRILAQTRVGPLARLGLNPFAKYYADYASPMMFVIALAHAFAWSGDRAMLRSHWDEARRIMDWAREFGDSDRDGYLEYCTRSPNGTKHQGWKDSGNAILYEDGSPVSPPLGTCELQGYWFAAQQLMAALSWVMNERDGAAAYWQSARSLKRRFNRDWWMPEEGFFAVAMDSDKRLVRALTSNVGQCIATGIIDDEHLPAVVGRMFAPDLFSGWGVRTLSTRDRSYNPTDYHLGSVWAVENASIVFGLRRFGFDQRAAELSKGLFDLAALYPGFRIPETVGGYERSKWPTPGAWPRANSPQLWNASVFPMLIQSLLGLQPVAPLSLLVMDPVLPEWLPAVILDGLRLGGATMKLRFWREADGAAHGEILHKRGDVHLLRQPPLESLSARTADRFRAFVDAILH